MPAFRRYVFAATIATIVSGAVAERIQFKGYMIYSFFLTGIIYPWASHWIWSADGFLNKMGLIDYAGGGCAHLISHAPLCWHLRRAAWSSTAWAEAARGLARLIRLCVVWW